MVLKYRDKNISSLDDIQKLKAKDLREILRSHGESAGETKADLVLKVFALLMRSVIKDFKIGSLRTADYGNTRREPGSRVTAHAC